MSEVLTKHTCAAVHHCDMVGVQFGPQRVVMFYQTAFKLAAGLLQAAKLAGRFEGVHPSKVAELTHIKQQEALEPLHNEYRRSTYTPNFEEWKVSFDRNLVVFTFDEERIHMHYSNAYEMYGWIRLAAKNAKRWAGDRGRQWTTRAHLADAEENDKFIYAQ